MCRVLLEGNERAESKLWLVEREKADGRMRSGGHGSGGCPGVGEERL